MHRPSLLTIKISYLFKRCIVPRSTHCCKKRSERLCSK